MGGRAGRAGPSPRQPPSTGPPGAKLVPFVNSGEESVATSHNSLGLNNGHWKAQAGLHSDFVF